MTRKKETGVKLACPYECARVAGERLDFLNGIAAFSGTKVWVEGFGSFRDVVLSTSHAVPLGPIAFPPVACTMAYTVCQICARVPVVAQGRAGAGNNMPRVTAPTRKTVNLSRGGQDVASARGTSVIAHMKKGMLAGIMDDGVDGPAPAPVSTKCPCGSGGEYDTCCGVLHSGSADDATPEAIVRARFSAYVKNLPKYITQSTHPGSKDLQRKDDPVEAVEQLEKDAAATMKTVNFTAIKKIKVTDGKEKDEQFASYEVAYKGAGKKGRQGAQTLAERSRYRKHDGRWMYFDALPLNQSSTKMEGQI